jgi:hypothetical protein
MVVFFFRSDIKKPFCKFSKVCLILLVLLPFYIVMWEIHRREQRQEHILCLLVFILLTIANLKDQHKQLSNEAQKDFLQQAHTCLMLE